MIINIYICCRLVEYILYNRLCLDNALSDFCLRYVWFCFSLSSVYLILIYLFIILPGHEMLKVS